MDSKISIRPIEVSDNIAIAKIIRNALLEFGAAKPGTVYFDNSTDSLFELFQEQNAVYFIAEENGHVIGGGGIFPTKGLPPNTCELVKMYLHPKYRGKGIGRILIEECISFAKSKSFENIYLETMPELIAALKVYEKLGFQYLSKPMGNSGHFGCDLWMLKKL
jgi:putative acetyltransferase